ncbi:Ercc4-type nuclease [Encephalitozoon intestinalis]
MKMAEACIDLAPLVKSAVNFLYRLSLSKNMKSRHCYKKMAQELEKIEGPLYSLDYLKNIKWAGAKTIEKIQELIDRRILEDIKTEEDFEKYLNVLSPRAYEESKRKLWKEGTEKSDSKDKQYKKEKDNISKKRKYIPGYRTGSYGIMKALWIREGIGRHEIARIGRNYCDSEFDFGSRHSAWSSMKTLVRKGFVYKEGRSKFYLTDEGRELAATMFANTSVVEEEDEITLLVDTREVKSRRSRLFFQEYFESQQIRHETRALEVGDFLWVRGERVCSSIIERKRGSDLVSSIVDGRFKEQKNRLKNTGIRKIFYIVEGLKNSHMQNVGKETIVSCMAATRLEGFIVMETEDIGQTGSVIRMIDYEVKKEQEKKKKTSNKLDHCEESSECLEDPDEEMEMSYESFIDKSTKSKGKTQTYLLYMSLLSIKGIGHKKALILAERYKTIGGLISRVKADGVNKLYDFEINGKKISRKNANDIIDFFLK